METGAVAVTQRRAPTATESRRGGDRRAAVSVPACPEKNRAPPRRRCSLDVPRGQRGFLACETVDELIRASEFAPSGRVQAKPLIQAMQASTSDAVAEQQTPSSCTTPFETKAGDLEEASWDSMWPSLREAVSGGWDFCSDASDDDSCEELAPLGKAIDASWFFVQTAGASCPPDPKARGVNREASFAKIVGADGRSPASPPASGTRSPAVIGGTTRRDVTTKIACDDRGDDIQPEDAVRNKRANWWKKQHKASWSAKLQRKVANQKARRAGQSCQARGLAGCDAE